jgi:hypothetical protein
LKDRLKISPRRSLAVQPIVNIPTLNEFVVITEYPGTVDQPIINIESSNDNIFVLPTNTDIDFQKSFLIDRSNIVVRNYNIVFDWSGELTPTILIRNSGIKISPNNIFYRYIVPTGKIGYKIIMSNQNEYELIKKG